MTTIYVDHKPGTHKAYCGLSPKGRSEWYVSYLDMNWNIHHTDGRFYPQKKNAYRRANQLNHPIKHAIKKSPIGVCEAYRDGYTYVVRKDEDEEFNTVYTLSVSKGMMPPHWQRDFQSIEEVEEHLREEGKLHHEDGRVYMDWRKVKEGE